MENLNNDPVRKTNGMSFNAAIYMGAFFILSFLKSKSGCCKREYRLGNFAQNSNQGEISLSKVAKRWKLMKLYFNCRFREKSARNRKTTDRLAANMEIKKK